MADGLHIENHYISINLKRKSSDFQEIYRAETNFISGDGNVTKIQKFANSEWQMDAALKITFGYNSAAYCPVKMKFGVRRQNRTHTKQVR